MDYTLILAAGVASGTVLLFAAGHALADGEVCACDLAVVAGCSPPTASRHLMVLRHAGLISDERRGQQVFYRLTCPCVLTFAQCIDRVDAGEKVQTLRIACCA